MLSTWKQLFLTCEKSPHSIFLKVSGSVDPLNWYGRVRKYNKFIVCITSANEI